MNAQTHAILVRAVIALLPEFGAPELAALLAAHAEIPISIPGDGKYPGFDGPLIEGASRWPDMIAMLGTPRDQYEAWANHHWSPNPGPDAHLTIAAGFDGTAEWLAETPPRLRGPGLMGDLPWYVAARLSSISDATAHPVRDGRVLTFDIGALLHMAGGDCCQIPHTSPDHAADRAYHHLYEGQPARDLAHRIAITKETVAPHVTAKIGDVAGFFCKVMTQTAQDYPAWFAAYSEGRGWCDVEHLMERDIHRAVGTGISALLHLDQVAKRRFWARRRAA